MRRSILTSIVLIGAVIAVIFGAGTFAQFTDDETIDGSVQTGYFGIEIHSESGDEGDDEEGTGFEALNIIFDDEDCNPNPTTGPVAGLFAPGESCIVPVTVNRGEPSNGTDFSDQFAATLQYSDFQVTPDGGSAITDGGAGDLDDDANEIGIDCEGDTDADWTFVLSAITDGGSVDGSDDNFMPFGTDDDETFTLTVTFLSSAENGCQGSGPYDIDLDVDAVMYSNPHATAP